MRSICQRQILCDRSERDEGGGGTNRSRLVGGGGGGVRERSGRGEKSEDSQIGDGEMGGTALSEIRRRAWEPALQM